MCIHTRTHIPQMQTLTRLTYHITAHITQWRARAGPRLCHPPSSVGEDSKLESNLLRKISLSWLGTILRLVYELLRMHILWWHGYRWSKHMCSNLLFRPPTGPCKWDYFTNDNRWQLKFKFLEGVLIRPGQHDMQRHSHPPACCTHTKQIFWTCANIKSPLGQLVTCFKAHDPFSKSNIADNRANSAFTPKVC